MADKILWDCHVLKSCVAAVMDGRDDSAPASGKHML